MHCILLRFLTQLGEGGVGVGGDGGSVARFLLEEYKYAKYCTVYTPADLARSPAMQTYYSRNTYFLSRWEYAHCTTSMTKYYITAY